MPSVTCSDESSLTRRRLFPSLQTSEAVGIDSFSRLFLSYSGLLSPPIVLGSGRPLHVWLLCQRPCVVVRRQMASCGVPAALHRAYSKRFDVLYNRTYPPLPRRVSRIAVHKYTLAGICKQTPNSRAWIADICLCLEQGRISTGFGPSKRKE